MIADEREEKTMEYPNDNKLNQPGVKNQGQNFSNMPSQNPSRNLKIIIGVLIALLVGALGVAGYFVFKNKTISPNEQPTANNNQNTSTNTPTPTQPVENKKVYFGKGFEGKYSLVDIDSGATKDFIPAGYTIIDQHDYDIFPDYLILQKGNDLFSFNLENQLLNSLFSQFPNLKLKTNEQVNVEPSITEKNKFYVVINEYNPNEEQGMGLPTPINTRSYFFDASVNKLESTKNITFDSCYKYDSKNQRFFTWPCEEGIGSSIPLSVKDLNDNNSRDIVSMQDYGLKEDDFGPVSVKYNNGMFMISEKSNLSKITVVNPVPVEPTKDVYVVNSSVKSQLNETYPYSETIDKSNNTIVIGGDDFILLLRFDSNKQITQSTYLPDKEIYAGFIFAYNGKLYYQAKDNIRVVNLDTWQVEKSIPSTQSEEITLISLIK